MESGKCFLVNTKLNGNNKFYILSSDPLFIHDELVFFNAALCSKYKVAASMRSTCKVFEII